MTDHHTEGPLCLNSPDRLISGFLRKWLGPPAPSCDPVPGWLSRLIGHIGEDLGEIRTSLEFGFSASNWRGDMLYSKVTTA